MNLNKFKNKTSNSSLSAAEWNELIEILESGDTESTGAVDDVLVDGESVVGIDGIARIDLPEIPEIPEIPVTDVQVDGVSIVTNGVANITMLEGNGGDESYFFVNEERVEPVGGVVVLRTERTYVLSGKLVGQVVVRSPEGELPADDTYIVLDGVEIISTGTSGILYEPEGQAKSLVITMTRDSVNSVILPTYRPIEDGQGACIQSNNNLKIQGVGYLTLVNKGGHGIKASELSLTGRPHIWVSASHDGVHGSQLISIDDGVYFIDSAKDGFGTGTNGKIYVFGGKVIAYNILENVFDSQVEWTSENFGGMIFAKENPIVETDCNIPFKGMRTLYAIDGLDTFGPADYFGVGTVKCYTLDESKNIINTEQIAPVDGVYTPTTTAIEIQGYINGRVDMPTNLSKCNITLNECYIETDEILATIFYHAATSRLKLSTAKDTINFIMQNSETAIKDSDAVKSENNLTIELKAGSHLIATSKTDDGLDGGDVNITDGKGTVIVKNCGKCGIKATALLIGPDAESTADKNAPMSAVVTKGTDGTTFNGSIVAINNGTPTLGNTIAQTQGVGDLGCTNGKWTKGSFYVDNNSLKGACIFCENLIAYGKMEFDKSPVIFFKNILIPNNNYMIDRVPKTREEYKCFPYRKAPILA